jgi:hypothetical protein
MKSEKRGMRNFTIPLLLKKPKHILFTTKLFDRMVKKIFIIVFLLLGNYFQSVAQGDLLITPTRVIFEGRKQSESIFLVNVGTEKASYSISFINNYQTEEGAYKRAEPTNDDEMFADKYLRFYPRTVSLEPGESQTIKLQCRRTPEMKDGEYRSHLYFRSEESYEPLGKTKRDSIETISVKLTPVYGISIPVIVRSGEVNVSASLGNFEMQTNQDATAILKLTINRAGNMSVIGNLSVEYIPEKGKAVEIGALKNLAVYPELNKRIVSIHLNQSASIDFKSGKLRITYGSLSDAKKQEVFAKTEIDLK